MIGCKHTVYLKFAALRLNYVSTQSSASTSSPIQSYCQKWSPPCKRQAAALIGSCHRKLIQRAKCWVKTTTVMDCVDGMKVLSHWPHISDMWFTARHGGWLESDSLYEALLWCITVMNVCKHWENTALYSCFVIRSWRTGWKKLFKSTHIYLI